MTESTKCTVKCSKFTTLLFELRPIFEVLAEDCNKLWVLSGSELESL